MPYASSKEVPPAVKRLPAHAMTVWRKAFNSAIKDNSESSAFKIAWHAVQQAGFTKNKTTGKWSKTR